MTNHNYNFQLDENSHVSDPETVDAITERLTGSLMRFLTKRQRKLTQSVRQTLPKHLQHLAEPVVELALEELICTEFDNTVYLNIQYMLEQEQASAHLPPPLSPDHMQDGEIPF